MKKLIPIFCFACLIGFWQTISAQKATDNYKKRSPIYDYSESQLNSTDTIPDFETKTDKLKITGTIFQSDGVTPAKDVLLYIYQPDENGDFETKIHENKRYVHHRGWVKTNAEGHYTFYTFVPGSAIVPLTYPRTRGPKHIFPVIKEPNKPEYELEAFLFDDDPLLTKSCRKRLARRGIDCILKLVKKDDMFVATRDIILDQNSSTY